MRVLHVIPSLSTTQGGPSTAVVRFAQAAALYGAEVEIVSSDDDGPGRRLDVALGQRVAGPDGYPTVYFRKQTEFYKTSWPLRSWLRRHVADYDIVHVHALFSFSSIAAAHAARRVGVPYIVRPLGVLNRWGMANRRALLKTWSLRFIELPVLRGAAAIHYTSERERAEAAAAHPVIEDLKSDVIPIPVEPDKIGAPGAGPEEFCPGMSGRQMILFLSRFDPKKGIELLLEAFAQVGGEFHNCVLVIAGKGSEAYESRLRDLAAQLGIAGRVFWPGFVSGPQKAAAFGEATIFVLPSYSENFGIAAVEAMAAGVPVLLSDQVAVADDVREAHAGRVVRCEAAAIATALRELLADPTGRSTLARKGRDLVRDRYSLPEVGRKLIKLYESVMSK